MSNSDLQINVRIRKILASHWIDLRDLHYRAYKGTVRLSGYMKRINGIPTDVLPMPIPLIEHEVRRIEGVKLVFFDLENFKKNVEGSWVEQKS